MTYQFECIQKMRFEVYDVDDSVLAPDFCLGYTECTLAEVGERDRKHTKDGRTLCYCELGIISTFMDLVTPPRVRFSFVLSYISADC